MSFSIILSQHQNIQHPLALANIHLQQQFLSIPNKVRKKSNGFSSPVLTDAKGFLLSSSEFRIFLLHASAKPSHVQKKKNNSQNITEVTYIKKKKNSKRINR